MDAVLELRQTSGIAGWQLSSASIQAPIGARSLLMRSTAARGSMHQDLAQVSVPALADTEQASLADGQRWVCDGLSFV